jgi:hypothetical protein
MQQLTCACGAFFLNTGLEQIGLYQFEGARWAFVNAGGSAIYAFAQIAFAGNQAFFGLQTS